jgi:hypothetical protein
MYKAFLKMKQEYLNEIKEETQNKFRILTLDITDAELKKDFEL